MLGFREYFAIYPVPIMRLLLVKDGEILGHGLSVGLRQEGYSVEWVRDGRLANIALRDNDFELMILGIGLPGPDEIQAPAE